MKARFHIAIFCLALSTACGGGGGSSPTPTSPTPGGTPTGTACGALGSSSSLSILNGNDCPTGASSVVLLNMRSADGTQPLGACSGTVISQRAILTAAHCVDEGVGLVRMWLGTGPEITAVSFTAHPSYRKEAGSAADVAVVFMADPIGRTPVSLLLSRDARFGEQAVIAGWGRDQNNIPATLRAGFTQITSVGGTLLETVFNSMVSSVCSGDSGGPILLSEGGAWTIGGVTSATSANVCNTGTNFYVAIRNNSVSSFVQGLVPDAVQR